MSSLADNLERDFSELEQRLREPSTLSATRSDPIYYFAYDPSMTLEVRRRLPAWIARLRNDGLDVERLSFVDLLWEQIDASGRWDEWLEYEGMFDQEQVNKAVRNVLGEGEPLVARLAAIAGRDRLRTIVLLTETEALHPFFRVRAIESALHDQVRVPLVIFYPGARVGQYGLRFLNFYPEDNNYRASIIGGLP